MTSNSTHSPRWEAWPKNDRLKRWCVVDVASPGRGKTLIADNIRHECQALRIAATLDTLEALKAARAVLTSILGAEAESNIIAEQVEIMDNALAKAGVKP